MGLEFDGVSTANAERVDCGSNTSIDDIWIGGGSVCGWMYLNSYQWNAGEIIANKGNLGIETMVITDGWLFAAGSTTWQAVCFLHSTASNKELGWRTADNSMPTGQWKFLAVTWNRTIAAPSIYIDGISQTLTQYSTSNRPINSDAAETLRIGCNYRPTPEAIDGVLADVRLYTRVLTAAEILTICPARIVDGKYFGCR